MKYAVVDLGSNTIRMSIYNQMKDTPVKCIFNQKEYAGIIEYKKKDVLTENGVLRIIETLELFKNIAQIIKVDQFCCFATASLRNIHNADEVLERVRSDIGVEINIISGQDEAKLDFLGAYDSLDFNKGLIIDMGGGSTEIIKFKDGAIENLVSMPFGSLSLFEKFVNEIVPNKKEIKTIKNHVEKQINNIKWLPDSCEKVCLIGGTARAIARLHQELFSRQKEDLQGYTFDFRDMKVLVETIIPIEKDGIKILTRVLPERVHTLIPGLIAFSKILKLSGCNTITLSKNGVREGYLAEYILK